MDLLVLELKMKYISVLLFVVTNFWIRISDAATDVGVHSQAGMKGFSIEFKIKFNYNSSKLVKTTLDLTSMLQETKLYGEDAGINSAPWIVSIRLDTLVDENKGLEHRCSGIILNNLHILTSAQCVRNIPKHAQIVIAAGLYNLIYDESVQIRYPVAVDNGNYKKLNESNLSLTRIFLNTPLVFNNKVQPIAVVEPGVKFSKSTYAYQYGWTNNKRAAYLSDLQVSIRNLTNQFGCDKLEERLSSHEFCVASIACNTADHGSPLVQLNDFGIVSAKMCFY